MAIFWRFRPIANGQKKLFVTFAATIKKWLFSKPSASDKIAKSVIATVDMPNVGSFKVLEKLGFARAGQVHAYGSDEMYFYELSLLESDAH